MAEEFRIDSSRFDAATIALAKLVGLDGAAILKEECRQFLKLAVVKAPPFKTKQEGGTSSESDLSVGRKAVERDLRKTMRPISPEDMTRSKRMREIVQKKDRAAWNEMARNLRSGPLKNTEAVEFEPSLHASKRNRYGHVGRSQKKVVFEVAKWKSYRANLWKRVGILKSGWNAAISSPALMHGDKDGLRVPAYVKRHGNKYSSAELKLTGENISIDMTNRGVKWPRYRAMVNDIFRVRERAILTKMSRIMQGKATNLGFAHTMGS